MNDEHAFDKGFELGEFELAGGVAEGLGGAGVGLEEEAVNAGGDGGAGEGFEVLAGASGGIRGGDAVFADGMRGVEDDGVAGFLHFIEGAGVDDEVVVAEGVAAFGQDNVAIAGGFDFGGDFGHVFGREELAVLEVDDSACFSRLNHQGRLHAEVGGNLENVHDVRHGSDLVGVVNVREQREAELLLYFLKDFEAFVHAGPHVVVDATAVILLKARLVDDAGEGEGLLDFREFFRDFEHGVTRFNHAGAADEEELVASEGDGAGGEGVFGHNTKVLPRRMSRESL